VVSEQVSPHTVLRALNRLEKNGIVHVRNRKRYAGPRSSSTARPHVRSDSWPVVILLLADSGRWRGLVQHTFNETFMGPLKSELAQHTIEMFPAAWTPGAEPNLESIPTGIDEISERIRTLGQRYAGTFVFCTFPEEERLDTWISPLCRFGKPVVYLDSTDTGGQVSRAGSRMRSCYYRLHPDETGACRLALNELHRMGHRTVGIHGHARNAWTLRRTRILQSVAPQVSPDMRVVLCGPEEPFWDPFGVERPFQGAVSIILAEHPDLDSMDTCEIRRVLFEKTPSMTRLLKDHSPTALIGLSDGMTREYYYWLKAAGFEIPRDISFISFDNATESIMLPVSTIDFGLGRLGYLAAHLFIGDISIRADRKGFIPGPCTLVDRGSVGKPAPTGA